jgi:hypothetical protein
MMPHKTRTHKSNIAKAAMSLPDPAAESDQ